MNIKRISELEGFEGNENSIIKNIFSPENNSEIKYSLSHFTLKPGKKTKKHKLQSSEICYILKGEGKIFVNNKEANVKENDIIEISPKTPQYIENIGKNDLEFLCIVEPAWKIEDEEIME